MIAKNKKGKSFGGCVRYVMNESAEVLAAEGVLADDAASITRDFAIQRSGRPEIKQPVGHIAVAFSPEDASRMTNEFMQTLSHEYMTEMGIRNTQYIVVRHHNTAHEHFHIVYNRIDNDLKLISVNNDYRRNVATCKKLKDRHGLTYGTEKENVNRPKLTGADKVKYQIHDEIAANLPKCTSYTDLEKRLRQAGITVQYKYRRGAEECPENIQGVSFNKCDYSFKGSEIDRKFSHANLKKALDQNMSDLLKFIMGPEARTVTPRTHTQQTPTPSVNHHPIIRGVELTAEQEQTLRNGSHIFLEGMNRKDDNGKFASYVFLDDDKKRVLFCYSNPDEFVKYGKYEMRLRDKILVEKGYLTRATVKWYGGVVARPYIWKDTHDNTEYKESWHNPRTLQEQLEKERRASENRLDSPTTLAPARTIPPPRIPPPKCTFSPPKPSSKGAKLRR
jgi:hypothetical protein